MCKAVGLISSAKDQTTYRERCEAIKGEIGDAMISLMVLAGRFNWDIDTIVEQRAEEVCQREYANGVRI